MSYGAINGYSDMNSIGTAGDLVNALFPFLGPPNQDARVDIDIQGKNPVTTGQLPLAYLGSNMALQTIFELKLTEKNEWYTSRLLPWKKTDELNLVWTTFKFDKSYFEVLPFGGNPNFIQSSLSGGSDKLLQRGMGFQIAHGFWKTEMGRKQYEMNIQVLESSQQLTCYHLIVMAVLQAKNVYRNSDLKFKNVAGTIQEGLRRTRTRWAMCNKSMAETRKFIANQQEYMANNAVIPNILAVPPKTLILFSHDHESEYNYDQAGPLSQKVRSEGQKAYNTIRGIPVFETKVFNEDVFGEYHNPLRRLREYGSFFLITNFHGSSHLENYRNEERFAAKILDANKDQEVRVSGKTMFKFCNRFDSGGNLSGEHAQLIRDGNLNDLKRRFGVSNNESYVDMFVGYDPSLPESHYVMRYLGEMWPQDVTKDQLRDFSITAANKLKGFSTEEIQSVFDAQGFMDSLGNVDFSSPQHRAYLRAVVHSGTVAGGENKSLRETADGTFKNNGFGSINPPIFKKDVDEWKMYIKINGNDRHVKMTAPSDNRDIFKVDGDEGFAAIVDFVRFDKPMLPLGLGHMSGLRTLAHMYRNDPRGYDEDVLKEAFVHYNTIVKFHNLWKTIFPNHELGNVDACPQWFKTGSERLDEATAFAHNLYDFARYPFFGSATNADGSANGEDSMTRSLRESVDLEGSKSLGAIIATHIAATFDKGKAPTAVSKFGNKTRLQARLSLFPTRTTSQRVKSALLTGNLKSKLDIGYRSNHMIDEKGHNVQLEGLLFRAIGGYDSVFNDETDSIAFRNLTRVLDTLLSGQSREKIIDWNSLLTASGDMPINVEGNRPFSGNPTRKPVSDTNRVDSGVFLNTRMCINALCFREYADTLMESNASDIARSLANLYVRPMNLFNPTQPVAMTDAFTSLDDLREKTVEELNVPVLEMKFAAAPAGANTVSSLSTSPLFASHLVKSNLNKRRPVNLSVSSSGARKKTLVQGVLVNSSNPYADYTDGYQDVESSVYSGIPLSNSVYRNHTDEEWISRVDPSPSVSIPAHIAFSDVLRVFDFTANHDDILGNAETSRNYRPNLIRRFHDWAHDANKIHKIFAQSWITSRITRQNFETFWDQDVLPLVSFELHRPRQRYYMGSGFLAEGGDKLGNAFHGHHDFQFADDIITKTHKGNYTFMFSATIRDPKYVAVLEDIVSMGYVSGEDVSWIKDRDDFVRLTQDPDNASGSIIVKMVPYTVELPDIVQDISGRWNETIFMQTSMESLSSNNNIHGASAYYYGQMYGLDKLNHNLARRDYLFHDPTRVINTVVWRGHHKLFNPISQQWEQIITDQGPFGQNVYPGVILDRDGSSIKDLRLEDKTSIFG